MADELDPVELQFIGEMEGLLAEIDELVRQARDLAAAAAEASAGVHALDDSASEAQDAVGGLRDSAAEAAVATGVYRDATGRLRYETGRFVAEAEAAAHEMGHLRDEAATASEEVRHLGDEASRTAAKLDLMALSGASTVMRIAPLIGMIGGLIGMGAAVSPVFAAAALGLGAFAFGLQQAASNVMPAVQAFDMAQNTVGKAHQRAMQQYQNYMGALNSQQQQLVHSLTGVSSLFNNFAGQMTPLAARVLSALQAPLHDLLGVTVQFIQAATPAVMSFLHSLSSTLQSSGFTQFIHMMLAMMGPAIDAVMHLSGALLGLLGHALEALAPLSVPLLNMITEIIRALSGPLIGLLTVFQGLLMTLLKAIEPLIPGLAKVAGALVTGIAQGLQAIVPILGQVATMLFPALLKIIMDLAPVIENVFTPNGPFVLALQMLPPLLSAILPLFQGIAAVLSNPVIAQSAAQIISLWVAWRGVLGVMALARGAIGLVTGLFGMLGSVITQLPELLSLVRIGFLYLNTVIAANPILAIVAAIALLGTAFYELWQHSAAFRDFWIGLWHDVLSIVDSVVNWIREHWKLLPAILLGPLGIVATEILLHWQFIEHIFTDAWNAIKGIVIPAVHFVAGIIVTEFDLVKALIKGTWDEIAGIFRAAWDVIRGTVSVALDVIKGAIQFSFDAIRGIFEIFVNLIEGHWGAAWHALDSTAHQLLGVIKSTIMNGVADFGHMLWNAGAALVQGLIGGIGSMIGSLGSVIGHVAGSIVGGLGSLLGIHSPARATYEQGVNIATGWAQGMLAAAPMVAAAVAHVAGLVSSAHGGAGPGFAVGSGGGGFAGGGASLGAAPINVNVPITVNGQMNPQGLQDLREVVQEAILRYALNNQGNGIFLPGRLS